MTKFRCPVCKRVEAVGPDDPVPRCCDNRKMRKVREPAPVRGQAAPDIHRTYSKGRVLVTCGCGAVLGRFPTDGAAAVAVAVHRKQEHERREGGRVPTTTS